jgi:hypothetical protein
MGAIERQAVDELLTDVDGLVQLASWQLALVREVRGKIVGLGRAPVAPASAKGASARGRRRRGGKG